MPPHWSNRSSSSGTQPEDLRRVARIRHVLEHGFERAQALEPEEAGQARGEGGRDERRPLRAGLLRNQEGHR